MKAVQGIFTPWATITCYKCHGARFDRGFGDVKVLTAEEMATHDTPAELQENQGITQCHFCKRDVRIYNEVAQENNLAIALTEKGFKASLTQTGGMNSACEIERTFDGVLDEDTQQAPYYMAKYSPDDFYDGFMMSRFDENGEWLEEEELDGKMFDTIDEVIKFVVTLPDVAKL